MFSCLSAHNRPPCELLLLHATPAQEAEALQREMRALESERVGLLRDVALRKEMEAQYAKRGTLQARRAVAWHAARAAMHHSGQRGMVPPWQCQGVRHAALLHSWVILAGSASSAGCPARRRCVGVCPPCGMPLPPLAGRRCVCFTP